jgi:hypothetical protein
MFQKYFDILVSMYQQTFCKFACHAMKCTVGEYYKECIPCECEITLQCFKNILTSWFLCTIKLFINLYVMLWSVQLENSIQNASHTYVREFYIPLENFSCMYFLREASDYLWFPFSKTWCPYIAAVFKSMLTAKPKINRCHILIIKTYDHMALYTPYALNCVPKHNSWHRNFTT